MASPTYVLTIIERDGPHLTLDVAAVNHPRQTVPNGAHFVWLSILDAFKQRFGRLSGGKEIWLDDSEAFHYGALFKEFADGLNESHGGEEGGFFDKLVFYDEVLTDGYPELAQRYPKPSSLITSIEVLKDTTYSLDNGSDEQLAKKVLRVSVSDPALLDHCEAGASWDIYWW